MTHRGEKGSGSKSAYEEGSNPRAELDGKEVPVNSQDSLRGRGGGRQAHIMMYFDINEGSMTAYNVSHQVGGKESALTHHSCHIKDVTLSPRRGRYQRSLQ